MQPTWDNGNRNDYDDGSRPGRDWDPGSARPTQPHQGWPRQSQHHPDEQWDSGRTYPADQPHRRDDPWDPRPTQAQQPQAPQRPAPQQPPAHHQGGQRHPQETTWSAGQPQQSTWTANGPDRRQQGWDDGPPARQSTWGDDPYRDLRDQPAGWPPVDGGWGGSGGDDAGQRQPTSRKARRIARQKARDQAREAKWRSNRLAVPYRTDGPRVSFGLVWFAVLAVAAWNSPAAVGFVASAVAALAALQVTHAFLPDNGVARGLAAFAGFVGGIGGFVGGLGIVAGLGLATAGCVMAGLAAPSRRHPPGEVITIALRAALPAAMAAGCLAALGSRNPGALIALIAMVSAYEVGDYLVGSGSFNAVEGPVSGVVALGAVVFILWILVPAPFTQQGIVLFGAMTALCCPLGQLVASAILPRGSDWAPALRRIDSYLVAAPLWLLLLAITPVAETV